MIRWEVIKGIGLKRTVTCRKTGGLAIVLSGAENFTCPYWSGEDQAQLGTLTWAYNTPSAGTVDITVSSTIASSLALGVYQWVLQLPDASAAYARGSFEIMAGPGSGTATINTYCTYQDLLEYAPWIRLVSTADADQTGFRDKRVRARQWFDNVILANYRGQTSIGYGGGAYSQFSMAWQRRSLRPNQYISDQLAADHLVLDFNVVEITAKKTISLIGKSQIGINNQYAAFGQLADDEAEEGCLGCTAMIDTNADGIGDIPIPLTSTNTLFT